MRSRAGARSGRVRGEPRPSVLLLASLCPGAEPASIPATSSASRRSSGVLRRWRGRSRNSFALASGVYLDVAARPRHAHQDTPVGLVAGPQPVLDIHPHITFEDSGHTSAAAHLAATGRDLHAVHLGELEQRLAGSPAAHFAAPPALDPT